MNPRQLPSRSRPGFTLVELLVVITIIGILVGMLMPAVQSARETARINSCKNNVSQIAKAWQLHEAAHGFFPCAGWGYLWIGDPDYGFNRNQPGGWVYNILPFVEQQALHDYAAKQTGAEKSTRLGEMVQTPLAFMVCPSRRRPIPYGAGSYTYRNASVPSPNARTDYAANGGGAVGFCSDAGPAAGTTVVQAAALPANSWNCGYAKNSNATKGVLIQYGELRTAEIRDGLTCTYLVGEKYMNSDYYLTGLDPSDDKTMYLGWDQDIIRWTAASATPMKDVPGKVIVGSAEVGPYSFGSPHATAFNMSFCDGSVHSVNYAIDPTMHQRFGTRDDGLPTDDTAIVP